jgi:hypothetical protein
VIPISDVRLQRDQHFGKTVRKYILLATAPTKNQDYTDMNKVMIITGGSRGIGAATADLAGNRGYAVCVNYRHNRVAADTVVAAIERAGGRAIAVAADVAVESEVVRLFETVDKTFGAVTALVNHYISRETKCRLLARVVISRRNYADILRQAEAFLAERGYSPHVKKHAPQDAWNG